MELMKSLFCCEPDQIVEPKRLEPDEPNDIFQTQITVLYLNRSLDETSTPSLEAKAPSDFIPSNEHKHHKPLGESKINHKKNKP